VPSLSAEQRNKKQKNASAEVPRKGYDFPRRLFFCAQHRIVMLAGPSDSCPLFWFIFFRQVKKMNNIKCSVGQDRQEINEIKKRG
jgi:hypothetical protein